MYIYELSFLVWRGYILSGFLLSSLQHYVIEVSRTTRVLYDDNENVENPVLKALIREFMFEGERADPHSELSLPII